MKAKFLMILAAALMMSGVVCAQEKKQAPTPEQRIEKRVQRMQKKLMLDDATAAKFAPIYKEYLQAKFAARPVCKKCDNPTDAQIKENIGKRIDAQQKALDVEKKYYKKLSSVLTGRQLQLIFCKDNKKAAFGKNKRAPYGKGYRQAPCFRGNKGAKCPVKKNCCLKAACPKATAAPVNK